MKIIKKILSKIFSKKSLIIATSLLAILLIAIVTTHIIYNAKAKKHWANTKQAWTEYLGENDRQQRFPKVPAEQDFLQHPTIKADLAAKPEDKITSIFEMEFKNFDFKNPYTRPRTDEDWLTIIKGKTFTSRNESATFLLNALQEKQSQIDGLEDAIVTRKKAQSEYSEKEPSKNVRTVSSATAIISYCSFFSSRATLYLHSDQDSKAIADLIRVHQLTNLALEQNTLVNYFVAQALRAGIMETIQIGLREHSWSAEQLIQIKEQIPKYNWREKFKTAFISEYYFSADILELAIETNSTEELEQSSLSDKTFGPFGIDSPSSAWEEIVLKISHKVVPKNYIIDQRAKYLDWLLTYVQEIDQPAPIGDKNTIFTPTPNWLDKGAEEIIYVMSQQENAIYRAIANDRLLHTAIAVEQYYLTNQKFPKTLQQLIPTYLESIPADPFTGKPLHYEFENDNLPTLWTQNATTAEIAKDRKPHYREEDEHFFRLNYTWSKHQKF